MDRTGRNSQPRGCNVTSKDINERILDLWYRPDLKLHELSPRLMMPLTYPEESKESKGGILFVGMNPSFHPPDFSRFLVGAKWNEFDPKVFFAWCNVRREFDLAKALEIDSAAVNSSLQYYKLFRDFASAIDARWQHADLFLIRIKKQKHLKQYLFAKKKKGWDAKNLNAFARAQIEIFVDVVRVISPDVLVVANATVAHLLEDLFETRFDDETGTHRIRVGSCAEVPYFPSAMWKGGSMDTYSLQRLKWQIKRALPEAPPVGHPPPEPRSKQRR